MPAPVCDPPQKKNACRSMHVNSNGFGYPGKKGTLWFSDLARVDYPCRVCHDVPDGRRVAEWHRAVQVGGSDTRRAFRATRVHGGGAGCRAPAGGAPRYAGIALPYPERRPCGRIRTVQDALQYTFRIAASPRTGLQGCCPRVRHLTIRIRSPSSLRAGLRGCCPRVCGLRVAQAAAAAPASGAYISKLEY